MLVLMCIWVGKLRMINLVILFLFNYPILFAVPSFLMYVTAHTYVAACVKPFKWQPFHQQGQSTDYIYISWIYMGDCYNYQCKGHLIKRIASQQTNDHCNCSYRFVSQQLAIQLSSYPAFSYLIQPASLTCALVTFPMRKDVL